MNKNLFKTVLVVGMLAAILSCTDNGKGKNPEFRWAGEIIGAVKRYGADQNIDIVLDNLDTVRTVNTTDLDPELYTDAKRVVSHVYMNKRTRVGNHYVFNSKVDNIAPMPIKKVLDLSYVNSDPERVDSVGNDPIIIQVNGAIISGYYLDVRYSHLYDAKAGKTHNISFVADDEKSDGSTLYLAMRHNASNDEGKDIFKGLLSCDIKKYLEEATDGKLKVVFSYYDGTIDRNETISWTRPEYMN